MPRGNEPLSVYAAVIRNVANNNVHGSALWLADARRAGFLKCERTKNVRIHESDTITRRSFTKEKAKSSSALQRLKHFRLGAGSQVTVVVFVVLG